MALDLAARLRLGALDLDVDLTVAPGTTVALLGPNGAGKSTLLRVLAGLQPLDGGHLRLDGLVLDDPATDTFVPPERRPIGVVFQDYLLFPNLTALENVAFGLRARGAAKRSARDAAARWLDRVGLAELQRARVGQLSGGQQQRVALARALATEPRLLLLDEPLAALDAGTRGEVRRELRRHLAGHAGVRVLVTHDPLDAHALADRVVVVEDGRITQHGTLADITAHPRSRYVAELVGVNLLEGTVDEDRSGSRFRLVDGGELVVAPVDATTGPAFAAIHPNAVALHRDRPAGSPRNAWSAIVAELDHRADRVRVRLAGQVPLTAEITAGALTELDLQVGDTVWASVKATEITTYPA